MFFLADTPQKVENTVPSSNMFCGFLPFCHSVLVRNSAILSSAIVNAIFKLTFVQTALFPSKNIPLSSLVSDRINHLINQCIACIFQIWYFVPVG